MPCLAGQSGAGKIYVFRSYKHRNSGFFKRSVLCLSGQRITFLSCSKPLEKYPENHLKFIIKSTLVRFFLGFEHLKAFVMQPKIVFVVCSILSFPERNQRLQSVLLLSIGFDYVM